MLYIFDKDGTICQSKSGKKFINTVEDQELKPGVLAKTQALLNRGHILAVASNQGGVGFDIMSLEQARAIVEHAGQLIGAKDSVFCPHHPSGRNEYGIVCECRKPAPAMLQNLINWYSTPENTVFIGDRPEDQNAAKNAGVKFIWANEFFGE